MKNNPKKLFMVLMRLIALITALGLISCNNEFFPTKEGLIPVVIFEIDLNDVNSMKVQHKKEFKYSGYYKVVANLKKRRINPQEDYSVQLIGELKIRDESGSVIWENLFQVPLVKNQIGAEIAKFNLKDVGKTDKEYFFDLSIEGEKLSNFYSEITVYVQKKYIHSFLD